MYLAGKCDKGANCDWWHPPECSFFKQGNCSAGKHCSFVHSKDKAAPAPSAEAKAKAKAKAKPKAEPKAQGKVCYYQGLGYVSPIPLHNCFKALSDVAKKVRFSKHAEKQSVRHCKNPTYLKWGIYD